MARIALTSLVPFLLPFAAWGLWWLLSGKPGRFLDSMPAFALTVAGLLLAYAGFIVLALTGGADPSAPYQPPRFEGGRVVPGQFGEPGN